MGWWHNKQGYGQGEQGRRLSPQVCATLQVLLPFAIVCIVCSIVHHFHVSWDLPDLATAQLSWVNSTLRAPWLQLPYAGGVAGLGAAVTSWQCHLSPLLCCR